MMKILQPLLLLLFAAPCFASSPPGVGITTTTLPNGVENKSYWAAVRASGGCTPYAWEIISGKLPVGVSANPSSTTTSLNLTGTPKNAAAYSFTAQVKGCAGHISRVSYKIVIQAAPNHVVDLSWKPSSSNEIAGYNVYRAPDGVTWRKINVGLIASTLYSDSTVANDSTYYYAATAVNISGHESKRTNIIKVFIPVESSSAEAAFSSATNATVANQLSGLEPRLPKRLRRHGEATLLEVVYNHTSIASNQREAIATRRGNLQTAPRKAEADRSSRPAHLSHAVRVHPHHSANLGGVRQACA